MKVITRVSARHIHLTEEDFKILFGKNERLTIKKLLSQPGQFASNESVSVSNGEYKIDGIRVLGPFRKYSQLEISKTDAYELKVDPPVRMSGDLANSEAITIIGPIGAIHRENCCIIAKRHIHVDDATAKKLNIKSDQDFSFIVPGIKGGILTNVTAKVNKNYKYEIHIDVDDGNSHLIKDFQEIEAINYESN